MDGQVILTVFDIPLGGMSYPSQRFHFVWQIIKSPNPFSLVFSIFV